MRDFAPKIAGPPANRPAHMQKCISATLLACIALLTSNCDLPTQGPDFSFTSNLRAPLVFDKTFVFLGPDELGTDALLDTTMATFDSIFTVDPASDEIMFIQEIDAFDFANVDRIVDPIDIAPTSIAVNIGELGQQSFGSTFSSTVGVFESDPATAPSIPPSIEADDVYYPVTTADIFVTVRAGLIELDASTIIDYTFTSQASNQLTFSLTNNSGFTLTDKSFSPGTIPSVVIEGPGGKIVRQQTFPSAPDHGETVDVVIPLGDLTLPAASRYRFDIGTSAGMAPITGNPLSIGIGAAVPTLYYNGVSLAGLQAQTGIDASDTGIDIDESNSFEGIVTESGNVTLDITNDLPVPITLDLLEVRTTSAVESFPGGHSVFSTSGQTIPANSTTSIPIPIGQTAVSPTIDVFANASSPGTASQVSLTSADGISFDITGSVDVARVHLIPDSEQFTTSGVVSIETQEISFDTPADYVDLNSGALAISDLTNGIDVALTDTRISFPDILTPPYSPADTLVLRLTGGVDNPAQFLYRQIDRNESGRDILVDLAGLRLVPTNNVVRYNIRATSEQATDTRIFTSSDEFSTSVAASNLDIATVSATIVPTEVDISTDLGGDGLLDVLNDAEASVTQLDGLQQLSDFGIDGLTLQGTELSFNIETNIQANVVLYGAFLGVDVGGSQLYLSGTGANAVSAADPIAQDFVAAGQTIPASNLIKFSIDGASSAQKVTRSVILSDENSNIDQFVSDMPSELRFVGKLLVEPNGGRITVSQPIDLDVTIGASVPLHIGGNATLNKDVDADLTGLQEVVDPSSNISLEDAELVLSYANGLPLGFGASLEFIDASGAIVTTIPDAGESLLELSAAEVDSDGLAINAQSGLMRIPVSKEKLQSMATAHTLGLRFSLNTGTATSRLRASDQITVSLKGNFGVRVSTGD